MADFDPDAYLAKNNGTTNTSPPPSGGFDPDTYLSKHDPDNTKLGAINTATKGFGEISPAASAVSGASQGLTYGFADEGIGAGKATLDKIKSLLPGQDDVSFGDKYRQYQKEQQDYTKEAAKQNPKSYYGSLVGGSLLAPGGAALLPVKGAGLVANLARGAVAGGLVGAGTSSGNIDNQNSQNELAKDTGLSALIGMGGAAASQLISKLTPDQLIKVSYAIDQLGDKIKSPNFDAMAFLTSVVHGVQSGNIKAPIVTGASILAKNYGPKLVSGALDRAADFLDRAPEAIQSLAPEAARTLPFALTRKLMEQGK